MFYNIYMQVYYYDENFSIDIKPNISCIGFFDGVHLGHQELIKQTVKLAKEKGIDANLITFDPDPDEVILNKKCLHINSLKERLEIFSKLGLNNVIIIHFDLNVMSLEPNDFINKYLNNLKIETMICGYDFTFDKTGKGNYQTLIGNGLKTIKIDEVSYKGEKISSTRIKQAIIDKNYQLVDELVGYHLKKM